MHTPPSTPASAPPLPPDDAERMPPNTPLSGASAADLGAGPATPPSPDMGSEMPTSAPVQATPRAPRRPSVGFVWRHPAHALALGFGSGLSPWAPGTVGTLWAWLSWWGVSLWLTPGQQGVLLVLAFALGWWACERTARDMGLQDPGAIVWDEVLAFWLILWLLLPASPLWQVLAFALFRFFDAAKPGPVRWADQVFKGAGWRGAFGIMFDDLVAALCTLLVLALLMRILA